MSNRDDTEVEISSAEFVMCKINRYLITSYLMTSELESPMIFYLVLQALITKYRHLNTYISFFWQLFVPLAFQFLNSKG